MPISSPNRLLSHPKTLYLSNYCSRYRVLQSVRIHARVRFFHLSHDLPCKVEGQADAGLLTGIGDEALSHGPGQ